MSPAQRGLHQPIVFRAGRESPKQSALIQSHDHVDKLLSWNRVIG